MVQNAIIASTGRAARPWLRTKAAAGGAPGHGFPLPTGAPANKASERSICDEPDSLVINFGQGDGDGEISTTDLLGHFKRVSSKAGIRTEDEMTLQFMCR